MPDIAVEIEFLPVGTGSKGGDAILVRYGGPWQLMLIDGGTLQTGEKIVNHVRTQFGQDVYLNHVVLTHSDIDHASGLRYVLENITVKNLWLNIPWLHAAEALPLFADNLTEEKLKGEILEKFDVIKEIVEAALAQGTEIREAFAGDAIGPFRVLSPTRAAYCYLLPQFERTPEPNEYAIQAQNMWIGKAKPPSIFSILFEKTAAAVEKRWVKESWTNELLRDGGITSATNETSLVLYGDFGERRKVLLTGDAGNWALSWAAEHAVTSGLPLGRFAFVQIPHHGSRSNVGPTILNRLLGPIQPEGSPNRFSAFVSAPADDEIHPRRMVTNAFWRRGGRVIATQGSYILFWRGYSERDSYDDATPLAFATTVENYDE